MIRSGAIRARAGMRAAPTAPMISLVGAGVVCVAALLLGVYWLSSLGLAASVYFFLRLLLEAGEDLPIESTILAIASLQWIVGPMCAYWGLSNHYKFHMYVPEPEYMALAAPATILFGVGLYSMRTRNRGLFLEKCAARTEEIVTRSKNLPFYLVAMGFIFSYLADRVPDSLDFVVYVLSNIKYVGLIYLIFSRRKLHKKTTLVLAFCLTFVSSLHSAMFHDLLLWSAFTGMYAAYAMKPTMRQKLVLVALAVIVVSVIQVAKDNYRMLLMERGPDNYVEKFVTAVDSELLDDEVFSTSNIERLVIRFNQGWIISRIMQKVPTTIPYADGETILRAVGASLLPRVLYPDKPIAGGRVNYEKYTGFVLQSNTSMGISLLGESYINFGTVGAWGFMLVFGFLTSAVIRWIFLLVRSYPTIWLWVPLILLHFVKAETELLVQLNYLVKSMVLVLAFLWFNRTFLRWKL